MEEQDQQHTPAEEEQLDDDIQEWNEVIGEEYPEQESKGEEPEEKEEEEEEEEEEPQEEQQEEPQELQGEQEQKAEDEPQGDAQEPQEPQQPAQPPVDVTAAQARLSHYQYTQAVNARKEEILSQYLPTLNEPLKDGEGKPIRSHHDVMLLINPQTNEYFTSEEAKEYFQSSTQQMNEERSQIEAAVTRSAELEVVLQDEAAIVREQFKDVLESNPQLAEQVWNQYMATLKVAPGTELILDAPVSLMQFYQTVLSPYTQAAQAEAKAKAEAEEAARIKKEAEEEAAKIKAKKQQSSRSDIYGTGKVDTRDKEAKEWDDVANEYYNQ